MVDPLAIKTGVDRLVELIDQKKELSIADAAKMLGVPISVVEEWTDFLEEKGIIKVKYKFTVPYLVKQEIGREELRKKDMEFETKKESIMRKAEVVIGSMKEEFEYVNILKTEFLKLTKDISESSATIKREMAILERFDALKKNLEQELVNQQTIFKKTIGDLEIQADDKFKEYKKLKQELESESKKLQEEISKIAELKKEEDAIQSQLDNLLDKQKTVASILSKQYAATVESQERLRLLKKTSEDMEASLIEKINETKPLLQRTEAKKNALLASQQNFLDRLAEYHTKILTSTSNYKAIMSRSAEFLAKKEALEKGFNNISVDLEKLNKEINEVLKEARVLHALSKSKNVIDSIKHLENRITELEIKRGEFQKEVASLVHIVHKTAKNEQ